MVVPRISNGQKQFQNMRPSVFVFSPVLGQYAMGPPDMDLGVQSLAVGEQFEDIEIQNMHLKDSKKFSRSKNTFFVMFSDQNSA